MDNRKLLILLAAWVSAGLLSWFVFANAIAPKTEPQARVVVAARDMPLGTKLQSADLKLVSLPERAVPKGTLTQFKDALGRVLLVGFNANEPLVPSKITGGPETPEGIASTIENGKRAVSVSITDVTGVAGLIQRNSRVDVLFTRPGNMEEASTSTILQDIQVLSVGRPVPVSTTGTQTTSTAATAPRAATVVTLLLEPPEAQKLELAKSEGKISLALRNPTDHDTADARDPVTAEALDPAYEQRTSAARKRRTPPRDTSGEAAAYAKLASLQKKMEAPPKKEPEKPRVVIDVFRGDKHVQESFK